MPSAPPGSAGYDAFISYSRTDAAIAKKLQEGLQSFAKPWYRLRALRIFRDDASLAADIGLRRAIEQALDNSRWFILLACHDSARSAWVQREVTYWRAKNGVDHLLIVLTGQPGDEYVTAPRWDESAGDFDWEKPTVLPPCLAGAFADEPRFVRLGWACRQEKLSAREPMFHAALADLAAPLHGQPKDSIIGDDIRRHRQLLRLAWAGVSVLTVSLAATIIAAWVAMGQRDTARAQRNVAQARLLLAEARAISQTNPRVALLLDLAAWRASGLPEARTAEEQTAAASHYVATMPSGPDVYATAFRPDGRLLATGGDDRTVTLWNVDTLGRPTQAAALSGHLDNVNSIAFSPDGRTLATGSNDSTTIIWDIATASHPRRLTTLARRQGGVTAVAFSPDGRTLVTGGSGETAILWNMADVARPRPLAVLRGHRDVVTGVAFSNNGRMLATSSSDHTTVLWDIADRARPRRFATLASGNSGSAAVAFSPDSSALVTASGYGVATSWDVANPAHPRLLATITGASAAVRSVSFNSAGNLLALAQADGSTAIWDLDQRSAPRLAFSLRSNTRPAWSVAFRPDSDMIVTGTGATAGSRDAATVWNLTSGAPAHVASLGGAPQNLLAISGDGGLIVAGGSNESLGRVWVVGADSSPAGADLGLEAPNSLAFSPVKPVLATTYNDGSVVMMDLADAHRPAKVGVIVERDGLQAGPVAFGPAGDFLAVGTVNGFVDIVDARDLAHPVSRRRLPASNIVTALSFDPLGRMLIVASSDGVTTVWDTTQLPRAATLSTLGGAGAVRALAFSVEKRTLATGSDTAAALWDLAHPSRPVRLATLDGGGTGGITALAFGLNGRLLAVGGDNGVIDLWDLTDPGQPAKLTPITSGGAVRSLAFSPDGRTLVTAGATSPPQLWDVRQVERWIDADSLAKDVCAGAGGSLSRQEWAAYAAGAPYQPSCS